MPRGGPVADDTAADATSRTHPATSTSAAPAAHRPRWTIKATRPLRSPAAARTPAPASIAQPIGSVAALTNPLLLQASAGAELLPLLSHLDSRRSGLVLGRGRLKSDRSLRDFVTTLHRHGFNSPTVYDPEAYR